MKKILLLAILFFLLVNTSLAFQLETNYSAFGDYEGYVNLGNGLTFDFSVPLTSINSRGINLPIDISFNSIDYQDINSTIGKGWNLDMPHIYKSGVDYYFVTNNQKEKLVSFGGNYFFLRDRLTDIKFNSSVWNITTTSGITFYYEQINQKNTVDYRWDLTKIQDVYGNYLELNYTQHTRTFNAIAQDISYIDTIKDPSLGIYLKFEYSNNTYLQDDFATPILKLDNVTKYTKEGYQIDQYLVNHIVYSGNSVIKEINQRGSNGGEILIYNFTYDPSGITEVDSFENGNFKIGYQSGLGRQIVANITKDNGFGDIYSTSFSCDSSTYSIESGSNVCTMTTSDYLPNRGKITKIRYSDIARIGLVNNTKTYDDFNLVLFNTTDIYKFYYVNDVYDVYLNVSITNNEGKISKSVVEEVNQYGQATKVRDYGFIDTLEDDSYKYNSYYHIPSKNIYNLINQSIITDLNSNTLSLFELQYDSFGELIVDRVYTNLTSYNEVNYSFDIYGNLINMVDGNGNLFEYHYPAKFNYSLMTYSNNEYFIDSNFTYDYLFRINSSITPKGLVNNFEFDEFNRITKDYSLKNGEYLYFTDTFFYDNQLPIKKRVITKIDDEKNATSNMFYDKFKMPIQTQNILNSSKCIIKFLDYSRGLLNNVYDPYYAVCTGSLDMTYTGKNKLTYVYEKSPLLRLKETIFPNNNSIKYNYSQNRKIIEFEDNSFTRETYNYFGNIELKEIDYFNNPINESYGYNALGALIYSQNAYVSFDSKYDLATNIIKTNYSNGIFKKYYYDSNYNILRFEMNDVNISYSYDKLDNVLTEVSDTKGTLSSYEYDKGALKSTFSKEGNYSYDYDIAERLMNETFKSNNDILEDHYYSFEYNSLNMETLMNVDGYNISYSYDALGRLIETSSENGFEVETNEYNARNQVIFSSVRNFATSLNTSFNYDSFGRPKNSYLVYPEGYTQENIEYDSTGRIINNTFDDNGTIESVTYKYNSKGYLTNINNNNYLNDIVNNSFNMTYDSSGKLINFDGNTIIYDSKNRISQVGDVNLSYDAKSFLSKVDKPNSSINIIYDSIGRINSVNEIREDEEGNSSFNYSHSFYGEIIAKSNEEFIESYARSRDNGVVSSKRKGKIRPKEPNASDYYFLEGTTLFNLMQNIDNITNMTLANEKGKIQWKNNTNASYQDFDSNVNIFEGGVSINSSNLNMGINSSAVITLKNINCTNFNADNLLYKNGFYSSKEEIISGGTICNAGTNPSCTNLICNANNLTFTVPHFTGYAYGELSNLTINDTTDSEILTPNSLVEFFAYYTNASGSPVTNAKGQCNITIGSIGITNEAMNFIGPYWNYSTFIPASTTFNVSCTSSIYTDLTAIDNIQMSEIGGPNTIPEFSTVGFILAMMLILVGSIFIVKKKKEKKLSKKTKVFFLFIGALFVLLFSWATLGAEVGLDDTCSEYEASYIFKACSGGKIVSCNYHHSPWNVPTWYASGSSCSGQNPTCFQRYGSKTTVKASCAGCLNPPPSGTCSAGCSSCDFEYCTDDIDNDNDGLIDCADSDCNYMNNIDTYQYLGNANYRHKKCLNGTWAIDEIMIEFCADNDGDGASSSGVGMDENGEPKTCGPIDANDNNPHIYYVCNENLYANAPTLSTRNGIQYLCVNTPHGYYYTDYQYDEIINRPPPKGWVEKTKLNAELKQLEYYRKHGGEWTRDALSDYIVDTVDGLNYLTNNYFKEAEERSIASDNEYGAATTVFFSNMGQSAIGMLLSPIKEVAIAGHSDASALDIAMGGVNVLGVVAGAGGGGKAIKSTIRKLAKLSGSRTLRKAATMATKSKSLLKNAKNLCSFVNGTKVKTKEGSKNIEEIEIGDIVLSKNEITGNEKYKKVIGLTNSKPEELVHLYYILNGKEKEIIGKKIHPFWSVTANKWVNMGDLKKGERLSLSGGKDVKIIKIWIEFISKKDKISTYNFEVEDYDTYFITPKESEKDEEGLWVHNCNMVKELSTKTPRGIEEFRKKVFNKLKKLVRSKGGNNLDVAKYEKIVMGKVDDIIAKVKNSPNYKYKTNLAGTSTLKSSADKARRAIARDAARRYARMGVRQGVVEATEKQAELFNRLDGAELGELHHQLGQLSGSARDEVMQNARFLNDMRVQRGMPALR